MGSQILLLSPKREVKVAYSANKTTRCRNCQRYGHTAPICKYDHPVCSICALHHRKAEHHSPNPTCPKEGNMCPVAGCCFASPPHCANCGDDHPATEPSCPTCPKWVQNDPAPLSPAPVRPPPEERGMNTPENAGEIAESLRPAALPTVRRLLPVFEMGTPRSTRPTAPTSVARPTPGAAAPLPQGAPSPFLAPTDAMG